MNMRHTVLIGSVLSLLPYPLLAWAYAALTNDGGWIAFWAALRALIAARVLFAVLEWIGGLFAWHLYGKKLMIARLVAAFEQPKAPLQSLEKEDAVFNFDALPVHLQMELLRWMAGEGLLKDMRTEGALMLALQQHLAKERNGWSHSHGTISTR